MEWVEVPVRDWFKACAPNTTKAPPDKTLFKSWRVPIVDTEPGMYPVVNEGCNDYLEASGCTAFTTCCTDHLNKFTSKLKAEQTLDYNADRPNLVIFPNHPDAVTAYKRGDPTAVPSKNLMSAAVPHSADNPNEGPSLQVTDAPGDLPPPKLTTRGHMSWVWAEVLIEVKRTRTGFPFLHGEGADFMPSGGDHVLARGQIAEYALGVLRAQHRQAVFMLLILHDHARFIRFDRDGAMVSAAFNYFSEPRTMGEFFYRLFNKHAREDQRGRDPTAHLVTGEDAEDFRQLYKKFADEPDTAHALKFAGTTGWPVYDLEVTGTWSPDGVSPLTTSSPSAVTTHICRVGRPSFASTSVVGRGTRCFAAYDMTLNKPVFIKDTWRVDSPNVRTEAENYKAIWGRVAAITAEQDERKANRDGDGDAEEPPDSFVPTLLYHGDVFSPAPSTAGPAGAEAPESSPGRNVPTATMRDNTPIVQRTLTQDSSRKNRYSPRIHHRLVFKEICSTIEDFRNPFELVIALYSALRAHQFAWEECGILHRDISVGNILLYRDPANPKGVRIGFLADWDLAKTREQLKKSSATLASRSGTWQFMSALIQKYVNKVHAVSDDLESFLHVLNWCALKYLPHSLSNTGALSSYFFNLYDKAPRPLPVQTTLGPAFEEEGPAEKLYALMDGARVVKGLPEGHPFEVLLGDLTALCKSHYDTVDFGNLLPEEDKEAPEDDEDELWLKPPRLAHRRRTAVDRAGPSSLISQARVANATAARSYHESPLKDHTQFLSAFSRAVDTVQAHWRQPRLKKLSDQVPFLTSLGSISRGTSSKHEREPALPTGLAGQNVSRPVVFKTMYTTDNPPPQSKKLKPDA
ncbi:hypothetical protein K466DRAFT_667102 [Polyporus arcularius HHB13444]|uniref:Fungal-type protein kinase domain-containing protein n=1 Tax=Polyporus arcularius HHB13444 TaxID=1314778 RepID=A0A5C3NVX3_9APHY|nr:hypothetical protein K466DRAFT_667102 [Polyporus arcularius HHB13444]